MASPSSQFHGVRPFSWLCLTAAALSCSPVLFPCSTPLRSHAVSRTHMCVASWGCVHARWCCGLSTFVCLTYFVLVVPACYHLAHSVRFVCTWWCPFWWRDSRLKEWWWQWFNEVESNLLVDSWAARWGCEAYAASPMVFRGLHARSCGCGYLFIDFSMWRFTHLAHSLRIFLAHCCFAIFNCSLESVRLRGGCMRDFRVMRLASGLSECLESLAHAQLPLGEALPLVNAGGPLAGFDDCECCGVD